MELHGEVGLIIKYRDLKPMEMFSGVKRRTLAHGESIMITEFSWEKGSKVPVHSHPSEQASYIVKGELKITIGGRKSFLQKGDGYLVPPNVKHSQFALKKTITLDMFSPPREDYKEK